MRVLGVDPGLTRCGVGLVEGSLGRPLTLRHVEVVTTAASVPLPERLLVISRRIQVLIEELAPDVVAIERMFSQHNLHTVMGTAQASAAAVLAAAEAGLPVAWHTPSEVKAAVTGAGRADKAQVAGMVVRILRLETAPTPVDATDALALAICHIWRGSANARIASAVASSAPSRIPTRVPRVPAGGVTPVATVPAPVGWCPRPVRGAPVIAFVHGTVASVDSDHAVIDVGGVGLSVLCGPRTLAELRPGAPAKVATALVVREDSLTLFGFSDEDERQAFEVLQSVTGIGPRTAQAILAVLTVDQLRSAVAADDLVTLSKPPGIGRKGAARIALELKDRLGAPTTSTAATRGADDWSTPVIDGLIALGWPPRDARAAAEAVQGDAEAVLAEGGHPSVPALLRSALRHLDRA